jgi:drug/metabolite transporter (DMT)-like permease
MAYDYLGEEPEWLKLEHRVPVLERQVAVLWKQMATLIYLLYSLTWLVCFAVAAIVASTIDKPGWSSGWSLEGCIAFVAIFVGSYYLFFRDLAKIRADLNKMQNKHNHSPG